MELATAARYARLSSIKRSTVYQAKLRVWACCARSCQDAPCLSCKPQDKASNCWGSQKITWETARLRGQKTR